MRGFRALSLIYGLFLDLCRNADVPCTPSLAREKPFARVTDVGIVVGWCVRKALAGRPGPAWTCQDPVKRREGWVGIAPVDHHPIPRTDPSAAGSSRATATCHVPAPTGPRPPRRPLLGRLPALRLPCSRRFVRPSAHTVRGTVGLQPTGLLEREQNQVA